MTQTFDTWYLYHQWLIAPSSEEPKAPRHYDVYRIQKITEQDGKVIVDYESKK